MGDLARQPARGLLSTLVLQPHRWFTRLLLICAGFSGAAALVYQVVWHRQFLLLFGSTTAATAAVIAAFMGGLALGAVCLGQYAHRISAPLLVYAGLEVAIALYALIFPEILPVAELLYTSLWRLVEDQPLLINGLRLGLGLVILVPPTIALGSTLPLLVRILVTSVQDRSQVVGWIYGINAGGGAVGAVTAGLLLIPRLGVTVTYQIGIGLSLTAAIAATVLWRWSKAQKYLTQSQPPDTSSLNSSSADRGNILLPLMFFLSGFAAMGYEVIWTRILVLITGSSTYAFTLMLALYIVGLSIGSLWIAGRVRGLRSPLLVFAHLQFGVALTSAGGLWLCGELPTIMLSWYRDWGISFTNSMLANTLAASFIILPPTLLLGAAFPVAVRLVDRKESTIASDIGRTYGWMTLGNVAGALAAGGGMIALFGLQGALLVLAAVSVVAGLLSTIMITSKGYTRRLTLTAGLLAIVFGLRFPPQWDPIMMTSGVYKEAPLYLGLADKKRLRNLFSAYQLLFYKEGNQSTVSVVERPTLKRIPHRILAIDGKVDASTGADMSTQVLSGHLPLLFHPSPRRVFIIGLASGVTAGSVATHTGVDSITVAEIEPAVAESARAFGAFNHEILSDRRTQLILDDGRHALGLTRKRFDVIISEPSNPWMSGPARLFTQEFFQQVKKHLNKNSLFAQWVPLYGLSTALLKAEVRTFLNVFPYAALFQVSKGDLLLVGSQMPIRPRWQQTWPVAVTTDLGRIGSNQYELLSRFITGTQGLSSWTGQGSVNTDDNALLEFAAPHFLLADTLKENLAAVNDAPWRQDLVLWVESILQTPNPNEAINRLARAYLAKEKFERADFLARKLTAGKNEVLGMLAARQGDMDNARLYWQRSGAPESLLRLAETELAAGNPQRAMMYITRVPVTNRTQKFHYLQALTYLHGNNNDEAFRSLELIQSDETSGWQLLVPYLNSMLKQRMRSPQLAMERQKTFQNGLDKLRRRLERDEGQNIMNQLLKEVERLGPPLLSRLERKVLKDMITNLLVVPLKHYYRGVSLLWTGHPESAVQAFEYYLMKLPENGGPSYATTLLEQANSLLSRNQEGY